MSDSNARHHPSGRVYRSRREVEPNPPPSKFTEDPSRIVVPGLDTNATPMDQCEQLDQMITHKLENIDATMANVNDILASRILPAIKRFAISTEPVREASNFWLSFYEKAANIRIPMEYEPSMEEEPAEDAPADLYHDPSHDASATTEVPQDSPESSFMPGSAAISSTPARVMGSADESTAGPSWMSSLDSPLMRLNREMEALTRDDPPDHAIDDSRDKAIDTTVSLEEPISVSDVSSESYQESDSLLSDPPTPPPPSKRKGKRKSQSTPLLKNVLQRRLSAAADTSMRSSKKISELKKQNPYLPANAPGVRWDGMVDLNRDRDRPLADPSRPTHFQDEEPSQSIQLDHAPRTMSERGYAPTLGRTPKKQAAQRITGDMLRAIVNSQRKLAPARAPQVGADDTSSGLSTPPSMSRYGRTYGGEESTGTNSMATPPSMSRYGRGGLEGEESPLPTPPSMGKYAKFMERLQPSAYDVSVLSAAEYSLRGGRSRSPSPSPAPASFARYSQPSAPVDQGDTLTSIMDLPSVSRYAQPLDYSQDDDTGSTALSDTFAGRYVARPAPSAPVPSSKSSEDPSIQSLRSMMRDAGLEGFDVASVTDSPPGGAADLSGDSSFGQTMRPEQLALFGRGANDSFDSEGSSDSFDDTRARGAGALRFMPPPNDGDGFDDSFDDDDEVVGGGPPEEETVFGLAPARNYRQPGGSGLVLHGRELLAHTSDYGRAIGEENQVAQTPTPAGWKDS